MNKNELKAKLRAAHDAQKQVEALCDHLQELRSLAGKMTPSYGAQPGCGSGTGWKLETAVADIVDQEIKINESTRQLCMVLEEVRGLINLLPDGPARTVMYLRYLNYHKWERIATEMEYSWAGIHKLHGQALNQILDGVNKAEKKEE